MVTLASLLLVGAAFYWFAAGQYAIGLVAAWLMTFLDTVDGKLARVTVTHTKFGNVFDHGIDLVHPPFWYWAWMIGLQATGMTPPDALPLLAVIVGEIGRASCRERVGQVGENSVVAGSLKNKQ